MKTRNSGAKALVVAAGLFAVAVATAIGLLDGVTLRAQTVPPPLTFEVASAQTGTPPSWTKKRTPARRSSGIPGPNNDDPGRFSARLTMLNLVLIAYDIPIYQLSDPDDRLMPRLDIEARMPLDTTREQFNVMLQNLLAGSKPRPQGSLGHPAN